MGGSHPTGPRPYALLLAVPFALALSACGASNQAEGGGGGCHYLVVGREGGMACSADGSSWSVRQSGTDEDLRGVAARQDGAVVAVGRNGTVLYSDDSAKTFQAASVPTTNGLEAVAVDENGRFLVGGNDDHTYYSEDGGKSWTAGKVIDPDGSTLITRLIADGGDRFLAAGTVYHQASGGVGIRNRVYLSSDGGDSWSHVYDGDLESIGGSLSAGLQGLATDGAQHYVTVGWKSQAVYASGDPTSTWTASSGFSGDLHLEAVVWDADSQRFVVGDIEGAIYSSSDQGQSFSAGCTELAGQGSISDMVVGGGRLLAVGPGYGLVSSDGGDSCTTVDPIALNGGNLVAFAVAYVP